MVNAAATPSMASLPGYTVSEFETLAGIPRKDSYRLIKEGRIEAYKDSEGRLRISPFEGYRFIKNQQD